MSNGALYDWYSAVRGARNQIVSSSLVFAVYVVLIREERRCVSIVVLRVQKRCTVFLKNVIDLFQEIQSFIATIEASQE